MFKNYLLFNFKYQNYVSVHIHNFEHTCNITNNPNVYYILRNYSS